MTTSPVNEGPVSYVPSNTWKKAKISSVADETEELISEDPVEQLGPDLVQMHIFPCLDGRSLARCSLISRRWKVLSQVDSLWAPLCFQIWRKRAHLPLLLMRAEKPLEALKVYSIFMADFLQKTLLPEEMCSRIWELRVKPSCGEYWVSLDPSNHGEPALRRFFHCDGSVTADPDDPIWGGQESSWSFVKGKNGSSDQFLKINYWPLFSITRLSDGRWHLENMWASYTTQKSLPFETNQKIWRKVCRRCFSPRLLITGPKTLEHNVLPSSLQVLDVQGLENNVELFDPMTYFR